MHCVECVVCSVQFSLYIEHNAVFSGHPQCYSNIEDGQGKGCLQGVSAEAGKVGLIGRIHPVNIDVLEEQNTTQITYLHSKTYWIVFSSMFSSGDVYKQV